ncbi:MAG TPA: ABC transporter permease [Candidatus Limnocylindrales bacterium]|nr:ABC transporter permease [Candidatus Limnocylindrales bacterium]
MNLHAVGIVYRKELTEWLRDRRTLISTVVVPLLAFPLLITGVISLSSIMIGKAEKETSKVMIIDGEDSPQLLERLRKIENLEIVPYATNWRDQISNKEIRAAVEIPKGFQTALESSNAETIKIYFYQGELKSSFGANHVQDSLKDYRESVVKERLAAKNLPASVLSPFEIKQENVAPPEKVGGATFGSFIGYMVIILSMTGAIYPAIDLTAGEKERGTMETILSSPVARLDLVLGKFLLVFSASLTTAILSVISMGSSFYFLGRTHSMTSPNSPAMHINLGLTSVIAVFLMALPLAVLFAAVLMTVALFAKTYKEAQSYLTPMTFVVVIPAVASVMPGVELTPKLALIPILNTSLVCKEIITGTYHWNSIALIFASTCVYAVVAIFLAVKTFQRESVLFRS